MNRGYTELDFFIMGASIASGRSFWVNNGETNKEEKDSDNSSEINMRVTRRNNGRTVRLTLRQGGNGT